MKSIMKRVLGSIFVVLGMMSMTIYPQISATNTDLSYRLPGIEQAKTSADFSASASTLHTLGVGQPTVAGSTVNSTTNIVMSYIKLLNRYLWLAMIVLSFAVFAWLGFKMYTGHATGDGNVKQLAQNAIIAWGAGVGIILLSYTIVRLVINFF